MEQNESTVQSQYQMQSEFLADPVKHVYGVQGSGVDYHLQGLIRMVNESTTGLSFGITLFTASGTITGTLISRKIYFEKFGQSFQSGFEKAFPDTDWAHIAQSYADMGTEGDDLREEGSYISPPQFIHLDDAKLLGENGALLIKSGMLWRGKVKSVDGFLLGVIS